MQELTDLVSYMISYTKDVVALDTTVSKQEFAYSTLRERILNGTYNPGYRLVIDQLAREFGTSPIPVREAIRRLEAEGLVQYQRNSGACVTPMDEQAYIQTLAVLAVLEGYAAAAAAPAMQPEDFAHMRQINREMEQAAQEMNPIRYGSLNQQFHACVINRCRNGFLRESIQQAQKRIDAVRRTVFGLIPHRTRQSLDEHEALIRLMESGAPPQEIERAARQHKLNTLAAFQAWERQAGRQK